MKLTIENTLKVVAVTTALAVSMGDTALAETAQPISRKQAQAIKLAQRLTKDLSKDQNGFPVGLAVRVPGLLNGTVEVDTRVDGHKTKGQFKNPVILEESHPSRRTDKNPKLLDGTWVGIPIAIAGDPVTDNNARVELTPVQIHLGNYGDQTESLHLRNRHNTVLEGTGIYVSQEDNGLDSLIGFDMTGQDNFPSVEITASGASR